MITDTEPCRVCSRHPGPVCSRCRHRMAEQLADLPTLAERLRYALVPGGGASEGDRVSTGKGEAPLPVRLSALTLLAVGTDDARAVFVPAVRVWATVHEVPAAPVGADTATRPVPQWHREPVYDEQGRLVLVPADDQVGVLPIHEWLRSWTEEWRARLGSEPARNPLEDDDRYEPLPASAVSNDPIAMEWRERFGAVTWSAATRSHHDYLTTWLPRAWSDHPHIADFALSLRTLYGAIHASLNDTEDLEYLGRCPEEITDRGSTTVCGAELWQDPYVSVITCPRCRTETPPNGRIWLARRILDAFPIDHRRRYTRDLIDALRPLLCPACHGRLSVEWIPASKRTDIVQMWRPGTIACPRRCEVLQSTYDPRAMKGLTR